MEIGSNYDKIFLFDNSSGQKEDADFEASWAISNSMLISRSRA